MAQQQQCVPLPNISLNLSSEQNGVGSRSRPVQNQNLAPQRNSNPNSNASTASTAAKKPMTPSMGGFHFPSGMVGAGVNYLVEQLHRTPQQQTPPPQRGPLQPTSTASFSLKRSVDAMKYVHDNQNIWLGADHLHFLHDSASSTAPRRPAQGMGLAQQQQQGASVKREPFARLEIGEGGDVKRMKF
jgi:hypothetical protein